MTNHSHNPRPLRLPNRPKRPYRHTPRGARLAWRLVYLLSELLRLELRGWRRS
jgi:hypothetical protein